MTLFQKSLLATALLILALAQLMLIAVARGWIGNASGRTLRRALVAHRMGGYLGFAFILFIAYNCIFVLYPIGNPYKGIHALIGALAALLVISKVTIGRFATGLRRRMPTVGVALLAAVAGAWASSAFWYLVEF